MRRLGGMHSVSVHIDCRENWPTFLLAGLGTPIFSDLLAAALA
jgi:hypothetical protein